MYLESQKERRHKMRYKQYLKRYSQKFLKLMSYQSIDKRRSELLKQNKY